MTHLKCSGLMLAVCCLLAGCATEVGMKKTVVQKAVPARQAPVTGTPPAPAVTPPAAVPTGQSSAMESCSRELAALKRLDNRLYNRRKVQFDRLMYGASLYAGLRTEVAGSTQEAVDAMYRFRTGRLCAEISRDVLEALARQGDGNPDGGRQ
ncbi:hypothetical protein OE847_003749 [Salmonella enterica]|nr:hypothetical protein [Salmonella enterica]EDX0904670.1 hypothetical protein [Salmonella enterica subsp. enterica]EBD7338791.1 hypothetical protein [Salmonella enterica]ECP2052821.1 hypothetical protein [Salmonella enterica]ECX5291071.1 hypothetical protein [Salmonella enterica]